MGTETCDDAGVYRIGESCALVQTCDIITPLVDDPFDFGRIAAANAISDVYAMGGRPLTALNLVFYPACSLPPEPLRQIMEGGRAILDQAGVCLLGGHTVEDDELKYGLSVTGLVDPSRVIRNSTARAGDLLILTKPLGTGIITTALKGECATPEQVEQATSWMVTLNRQAAELMTACHASAATDITGFGLIGHSAEMAQGAAVTLKLQLDTIPLMDGVLSLIDEGMVPAGCYRNRDHYAPLVTTDLSADRLLALYDPQTSGGMLISLSPENAAEFLHRANATGLFACRIGRVMPRSHRPVEIV